MPSLNLDIDYFKHRRTLRLRAKLGPGAELLPLELWCHCARYHAEDGRLAGYSEQEVENACGWRGVSGEAARAMMETGFLLKEGGGAFIVPHWLEEQGHIASFKKRARAAAQKRWGDLARAARPAQARADEDGEAAESDATIAAPGPQTAQPEQAPFVKNDTGNAASIAHGSLWRNAPAVPTGPSKSIAFNVASKSMAFDHSKDTPAQRTAQETTPPQSAPQAATSGSRMRLVACYKTFRGIQSGSGWDSQNLERNLRAASSLLEAFKGELEPAAHWLCSFGEKMDSSGLLWTLDTAARHAWDTRHAAQPGRKA